jgi:CheY-like chemotaxis protein
VPLVLAIEPDLRQAAIVKRIVREKVLADVAVVDSRDAALEAIRLAMPDVLLISALLSPRDEDELIKHLRTLDNAGHLQTHTIPQLASALAPGEERASGGLLSAFRRKKKKDPEVAPAGCEPDMFAEEIRSYLQRAADKKRERLEGQEQQGTQDHAWRAAPQKTGAATDAEPAPEVTPSGSSWASPFEWKPSNPSSLIANPEPLIAHPESPITYPEEPPSLMAHLRPPSGVTTLKALRESLAAEETPLVAPVEVIRQEIEPVQIVAAATPDPEPIPEAAPIQEVVLTLEAAPIREAAPTPQAARLPEPAPMPDAGVRIKDSGLGIRDQRSGMRDSRLGALASWARSERTGRDTGEKTDDLYGLLMGLAVPPAVVAVGYGRGCRIRRVRVPAAPESPLAESNGPVILSKRALAEQREQRT